MEKDRIVTNKKQGNLALGIVGACIGGMIATIPWVLCYVYMQMILSILAILVALGAIKGYEIMGGKTTKYTWLVIAIISIICITIATYVAIPMLMLFNEGFGANFDSLGLLYSDQTFMGALLKDYVISFIFTLLGISGVITNLKNKVS